jgi:hypothetical protein
VTAERVRATAERLIRASPPAIAVVGAGRRSADFALTAERRLHG